VVIRRVRRFGAVIVLAASASSCTTYPEAQLNDAIAALDRAVDGEAPLYAGDAFGRARETLRSARTELAVQDARFFPERNYTHARLLLNDAILAAGIAEEAAHAAKRLMRARAEEEIRRAEAALESAAESLARSGKLARNDTLVEGLGMEVAAVGDALDEARQKLEQGRFLDALKQSMSAGMHANGIRYRISASLEG